MPDPIPPATSYMIAYPHAPAIPESLATMQQVVAALEYSRRWGSGRPLRAYRAVTTYEYVGDTNSLLGETLAARPRKPATT